MTTSAVEGQQTRSVFDKMLTRAFGLGGGLFMSSSQYVSASIDYIKAGDENSRYPRSLKMQRQLGNIIKRYPSEAAEVLEALVVNPSQCSDVFQLQQSISENLQELLPPLYCEQGYFPEKPNRFYLDDWVPLIAEKADVAVVSAMVRGLENGLPKNEVSKGETWTLSGQRLNLDRVLLFKQQDGQVGFVLKGARGHLGMSEQEIDRQGLRQHTKVAKEFAAEIGWYKPALQAQPSAAKPTVPAQH